MPDIDDLSYRECKECNIPLIAEDDMMLGMVVCHHFKEDHPEAFEESFKDEIEEMLNLAESVGEVV